MRGTDINPKLTIREGVKALGGATFFRKEESAIPSLRSNFPGTRRTISPYLKSDRRQILDWIIRMVSNWIMIISIFPSFL